MISYLSPSEPCLTCSWRLSFSLPLAWPPPPPPPWLTWCRWHYCHRHQSHCDHHQCCQRGWPHHQTTSIHLSPINDHFNSPACALALTCCRLPCTWSGWKDEISQTRSKKVKVMIRLRIRKRKWWLGWVDSSTLTLESESDDQVSVIVRKWKWWLELDKEELWIRLDSESFPMKLP